MPADRETSEVRWVSASEVVGYTMDGSMRLGVNDFLIHHELAVIISPALLVTQIEHSGAFFLAR